MNVVPPRSEAELVARAEALAGHTIGELAARSFAVVPADPARGKGFAGQLLERLLGATAGSRAQPDFPGIGVEMKTVPVDATGRTLEATHVCTAPLDAASLGHWETSWVRRKLARVLWVPLLSGDGPADRVVGSPVLWSPSLEDDAVLQADFEQITTLIAAGALWQLDSRSGTALHLRPKGRGADDLAWALDEDGGWVREVQRGFYLRTSFTGALLARHLAVAGSSAVQVAADDPAGHMGAEVAMSITLDTLRDALAPVALAVAGLDLADAEGAQATLSVQFPANTRAALREQVLAAADAGILTPKRATPTLTYGRVAKPAPEFGNCSIDAVDMAGAGLPHVHPKGEVSLCFAVEGEPKFVGFPEGFVVVPPGSRHVPEVTGGRMVIVYFLPDGAMVWE